MIKLIDLNYYMYDDISNPREVLKLQETSLGFAEFIKEKLNIQFIKHMNWENGKMIGDILYKFFKSKNSFWHIPFKTNGYAKMKKPDIVLVQGLTFPLQIIALKKVLDKKTKIIVQHHGEKPFRGIKKIFQKLAKQYISAYLFTSIDNADEWIKNKIIPGKEVCYEVLEASTYFTGKNKEQSKSILNFKGHQNFLWVGRLTTGKDPLTVLKAFEKYIAGNEDVKLHMIYQADELLPEIKKMLAKNEVLKNTVILYGSVAHNELDTWYSAADFYISGSHKEGSGYALIEAMACGCIPVVTNIPSFKKITNNGEYGFLFEPGNEESLLHTLLKLDNTDRAKLSASIVERFNNSLSFNSIADALYRVCEKLISE